MKLTNPFADPARRSRGIVWTFVVLIAFVGLFATSQLFTSSPWFCNQVCHNVHQDNAVEWTQSSHSKIGCVTCHYPVNMSPLAFTLDRVDKLLDIWPTITGEFTWPMNLYSHDAAQQTSEQCLQCHDPVHRAFTPSPGIKIDHKIHAERGIPCQQCHNRICHPEENYVLQLPYNKKKQDFSQMPACMRCHWLTETNRPSAFVAPGTCSTCHTKDFQLTPKSHLATDWASPRTSFKGHATAAKQAIEYSTTQKRLWDATAEEYYNDQPRLLARLAVGAEPVAVKVPPYWTIFECNNCHTPKFCNDCHGLQIPHPAGFKKAHAKKYTVSSAIICSKCHNPTKDARFATDSCNECHHRAWKPAAGSWVAQHPAVATKVDVSKECLTCHRESFCSTCHVRGKPSTAF